MKLLTLLAAIAIAAPNVAATQAATPPPVRAQPSAHAIELAQRYLDASHYDETSARMISMLLPVVENAVFEGHPDIPAAKKAAMIDAVKEASDQWLPAYRARAASVLANVLTEPEMQAGIAFWESPAGRSIWAKQQSLTTAFSALAKEMHPELMRMIFQRFCDKKVYCANAAPKGGSADSKSAEPSVPKG